MSIAQIYQPRLEKIAQLAERIQSHKSQLMEAAAMDAGFPVKITAVEVDLAVQHLSSMNEEIPWIQNGRPYGTVAAIFPYDAPVVVLARLGGGAILTGNRLRFSFSSWTPRSARIIAEASRGIESFEPILEQDNRRFGEECVADDAVRVLFISGSSAVGETYRKHYTAFDKLFFAGPGGMPAAMIFEDADIEKACRFIVRRAFINGGQYCTTIKKVLIHQSLYDRLRRMILELVRQIKVGDPLDPETDMGPIKVQRTIKILEYALKQCEGASLLSGGLDGEWVHPLVLEMKHIPDLELFGPFLALESFHDPEEAVKEVIGTRYGFLLAYFGTPPSDEAASKLHAHFGMVHRNPDFYFTPLRLPFGGKKESGWILERRGDQWIQRDGAFIYSEELVRKD